MGIDHLVLNFMNYALKWHTEFINIYYVTVAVDMSMFILYNNKII